MKNSFVKQVAILALVMGAFASFADPAIDRIVVRQQWPWSTDVCVDYRLTGVTTPVDVAVAASDNGRELDLASRVSGSQFALAESGTYRLFIKTDGLFEAGRTVTDKFKVKLTTTDSDPSVASVLYKVVDLESGMVDNISTAQIMSGDFGAFEANGQLLAPGAKIDASKVVWTGVTNNDQYATTKLVLRRIPAADSSFMMGTNIVKGGEIGTASFSYNNTTRGLETRHQVSFTKDFFIGVYELTQHQYYLLTNTKPSKFNNPDFWGPRPLDNVSFSTFVNDALSVLNERTSLAFALPTEAQWEFACRAGTATSLNNGQDISWTLRSASDPAIEEVARYYRNANVVSPMNFAGDWSIGTAKVGSYKPNNWGLYDMHGNVAEYCSDWQQVDLGTASVTDPTGPTEGSLRVVRNGHWAYCGACNGTVRSAYRWGQAPSTASDVIGFRLMLSAD